MLPFASFFKGKPKSPDEICSLIYDACNRLHSHEQKIKERAQEDCAKYLGILKNTCQQAECDLNSGILNQCCQAVFRHKILEKTVHCLNEFLFESRKDAVSIFCSIVRYLEGTQCPAASYIAANTEILSSLLRGYERQDLALNYGIMLRECLRNELLTEICLGLPDFTLLFDYVQLPTFDIASDAFATLKEVLTRHKMLVASYFINNFDTFTAKYNPLLISENYITRRQSLKLLGEILLDRTNHDIMAKYIDDANNLKILMNLLRDKSKNIQYEAFHVFKIFVANPRKARPVYDILLKNQKKLIEFLDIFQYGKVDDQLEAEKSFLVQQIRELSPQRRDAHVEMS